MGQLRNSGWNSDTALSNVPFFVTSDYMKRAILVFNVFKKMLPDGQQIYALINILTKSFVKVQAIFKSIQQEELAKPVNTKKWMKVPAQWVVKEILAC